MKIYSSVIHSDRRNAVWFLAVLVAVMTFLLYLPALRGEFLIWDDPGYVVNNPHIHSIDRGLLSWAFTDMSTGFWLPATWISYAFDYRLWGLDPFGFHLTSLVLHALNSLLVVILVVRLLQCARAGKTDSDVHPVLAGSGILISGGVAGALFGLHPQHVESVAWITERKDVLNAFFFLLSLLCYLSYTAKDAATPRPLLERICDIRYIGAIVFFLLSLLSKPMTVVFPIVLLLIDWYPLARYGRRRLAVILAEKLPFFLGAAGAGIVTMNSASPFTLVTLADVSPWSRLLVAGKAVIAYIRMMLVPAGLSPLYEHPGNNLSTVTLEYGGSLLLVIIVTACAISVARRFPVWPAVWAYYLVTLLPVLGFAQNGPQEMADRFTYLPSVGPLLLAGLAAAWLWSKAGAGGGRSFAKWTMVAIGTLYLLLLSGVSLRQMKIWNNSVSLWNHVIENGFSRSSLAYNNRGMAFLEIGNYQQAIDDCTRALSIQPGYFLAHYNRGKAFMLSNRPDLAIEDLSRAIVSSPRYADAYALRGEIYREQGKPDQAIAEYNAALALNPQLFEVYNYRGIAFKELGKFDRAIEDYNRNIALLKDSAEAYNNRGVAYRHLGRLDLAVADYSRAIAINPGFSLAYCNRGIAYKEKKNYQQAVEDFKRATSLSPDLIKAYLESAECFRLMGRPDLARQEYEAACSHNSLEGCNALKMQVK
jgi:tetratricopeptide (TPR) repeat protein